MKIKQTYEEKKASEKLVNQIKKVKERNEKSNPALSEQKNKENAFEYYSNLSNEEKIVFQRELEKKKLRDSYVAYLKYVYPDFIVTRFHAMLSNICESVVRKVEAGQSVRVLLSVPPQHGKSTVVTKTLPSWFVGRNPKRWAILTAYNSDIAEEFSDNNRQLIKNYGADIFGIETNASQDNKTLFQVHKIGEKEVPSSDSGIMGVGIGGGITGHGGSLIIVDDPYKNSTEAENPNIRANISRVFKDSVLTRARGKGNAVIVIHTRWNDDDLIGELEKTGDWITINIPCVWEKGIDKLLHRKVGETLCPELGFDCDWAIRTEKAVGKRVWNALYQGKPYIDSGDMVSRDNIKFYDKKSKPLAFEEITLSCDLSFGGKNANNDPCCLTVIGRIGGNHYILDVINKKLSFTETLERIRYLCGKYPIKKKLIEKKANGQATIDSLNREIGGFVAFDPGSKSKIERLQNCLPFFEAGNMYFPDESINSEIDDLVEQLLRFPNTTHDDFVDTLSQYLLNYEYKYGGKIATDTRFKVFADAIRGLKI